MKKETNIYIVPSPFPYLCACEAVKKFGKDKNNVLILLFDFERNLKNDKKVLSLAEDDFWDEVFHVLPQKSSFAKRRAEIQLTRELKKKYGRAAQVFAAEVGLFFVHMFASSLRAKELVILDEGALTLNLVDWIRNGDRYLPKKKSLGTRLLFSFAGLSPAIIRKFAFFTMYNVESIPGVVDAVYKNNFSDLRKGVKENNPVSEDVYVLGWTAWNQNTKYMLDVIAEKFSGKQIIFLPHRALKVGFLEYLEEHTDFIVDRGHDGPVELKFIAENKKPSVVVGCCCTALDSLRLLYPDCKFYNVLQERTIEFNSSELNSHFEANYETIDIPPISESDWVERGEPATDVFL